ncbi:MAG: hypothetical protein AAFX78_05090 [Cyanobacteria bacterium J06638_20]
MTNLEELDARLTERMDKLTAAVASLTTGVEATNQQLGHLSELLTVYVRDTSDRLTRIEQQLERVANITESQAATAAALANLVTELASRR